MIAGSVIERELRVRARQRLLPWMRVVVGGLAALMAISAIQFSGPGPAGSGPGKVLLQSLAWLIFAFCLFEGTRQTADCVSQERREGTLGLLFLTDLTGFDVVLGKLAASTLITFYGLLAAMPAMSISLLAGGATAGEFWRIQIVLLNTLFFGAAAGVWVSSRSQDDVRSQLGALGLVFAITILPAAGRLFPTISALPSPSPAVALHLAEATTYVGQPAQFWWSLLLVHVQGWLFLALSAHGVMTSWRSVSVRTATPRRRTERSKSGWNYRITPSLHARPRSALTAATPLAWLAERQRGLGWLISIGTLTPLFLQFGVSIPLARFAGAGSLAGAFSGIYLATELVSVGLLALAGARWFSAGRRDGTLELLMSTPVDPRDLVRAQWAALRNRLRWPFLIMAFLVSGGVCMAILEALQRPPSTSSFVYLYQLPRLLDLFITPLAALWAGMWFGASSTSTSRVVAKTFLWVSIMPWVVLWLLTILLGLTDSIFIGAGGPTVWFWVRYAATACLGLVYLVGLALWARRRLFTRLRDTVAAE